jgi:hypothetical protein
LVKKWFVQILEEVATKNTQVCALLGKAAAPVVSKVVNKWVQDTIRMDSFQMATSHIGHYSNCTVLRADTSQMDICQVGNFSDRKMSSLRSVQSEKCPL